MKNIKTSIINWTIMAFSFFITLSLTYIAYWYVSWLWWKIGGNSLTSSDWNSLASNIDEVKNSVSNISNTPTWAVISFNLTTCPMWWSEYIPARWRFIRWIDSTWTNDNIRIAWDLQADDFKNHSHQFKSIISSWWWGWYTDAFVNRSYDRPSGTNYDTNSIWWSETRPKNVALLFCQKN